MDNEQVKTEFDQTPLETFTTESNADTYSVLLKYSNKKSLAAILLYFLLILAFEAAVLFFISGVVDKMILIYVYIGSLALAILFVLFMIYGNAKNFKKQIEAYGAKPSHVVYELCYNKLVIKKYVDGELKALFTAEKGTITYCDVSKNVFIFQNEGKYFGIRNELLDQHDNVKQFIIRTSAKKSKKVSV